MADGGVFAGLFRRGTREGAGVYTYPSGAAWTGTWRRGFGTVGTLRDAAGRTLRAGIPFPGVRAGEPGFRCVAGTCTTGQGTGVWRDSTRYVGAWRDGLRHGRGAVSDQHDTAEGTFAHGRLEGPGRQTIGTAETYVGTFHLGMREGFPGHIVPVDPLGSPYQTALRLVEATVGADADAQGRIPTPYGCIWVQRGYGDRDGVAGSIEAYARPCADTADR